MPDTLFQDFEQRNVADYLAALSSGAPAPGGGSAAGLAGALGCSLGAMVCNLTLARAESDDIRELERDFIDIRQRLLSQAEADERVFAAYRAATALPRSTEEEKTTRRAAVEDALVAAAEVPVEMVTLGLEALASLRKAAGIGTPHALGDLRTGGYLLQAMILGSIENMDANAALMREVNNRSRFERAADSGVRDLASAMAALDEAIAARQP